MDLINKISGLGKSQISIEKRSQMQKEDSLWKGSVRSSKEKKVPSVRDSQIKSSEGKRNVHDNMDLEF